MTEPTNPGPAGAGPQGDPVDPAPSPSLDEELAQLLGDAASAADADGNPPLGDPALDEVGVLSRERDEYLDALRRLQADFDNYRRRVRSDTELEVGRATEKLVARLLPVLDTFELALAHEANPDQSPLAKVHDQLLSALESEGLERLWPEGLDFDPAEAEAVLHEPGEGGGPVVSEVLRAGYRWKGRVMRAAMVKVKD
jgi:molecular chaperone GrpE